MNTAQPIRNREELDRFRNYFSNNKYNPRNQLLVTIGLNTALRISDILNLQWGNVYDPAKGSFKNHISIVEQKTGKRSCTFINENTVKALENYKSYLECKKAFLENSYLFAGRGGHISRVQAYRIIREAASGCNLSGVISPHSLRKTFGYHAWKQGVKPALLMDIYNHSSFAVTQRYLGIDQDDRDEVFRGIYI